jgi:hypothetical protein
VFYVGTIQRIHLPSDEIYSDITLVLGLIRVEFFFVFIIIIINCHRWFVLCLACISYLVLEGGLLVLIGPK